MAAQPRILIRSAGGPRLGYGHLVRARTLARTLRCEVAVSLRGGSAAEACAKRLALPLVGGSLKPALAAIRPALLVIDDPDERSANRALLLARRRAIPVASIHDLGLSVIESDLVVDGSIAPPRLPGRAACLGPRFALIDPAIRQWQRPDRNAAQAAHAGVPRVFIALGGGPRAGLAAILADAIAARLPHASIRVAGGLAAAAQQGVNRSMDRGVIWLGPQGTLGRELAACDVAVLAGGVTLYEACAIGTPVVAVPVVAAQDPAIRAFARRNAIVRAPAAPRTDAARLPRLVAERVRQVLGNPAETRRRTTNARRLVDGLGAGRVAGALERLARRGSGDAGGSACGR